MSADDNPRVFVGVFPLGGDITIPADVMARASAELDEERERRRRLAEEAQAAADVERAKTTRRARIARRFKPALKMFRL